MSKEIDDAKKILKSSKVILLIDWSGINVPRTLVNAGFTVFCHSPDGYTKAEIVNESLQPANSKNAFPPQDKEEGWLIFRPLENPPPPVDIVVVYRPENEHADIITNYVLPFDAKIFWLQYPITSAATELFARKHGLTFIEGYDIAAIANS